MFYVTTSFAAGVLAALSPCVFPVLPIMAGSSMSTSRKGPLVLAFGLVVSFALMGLLFSSVTTVLGLEEETLRAASAWLLLLAGAVSLTPALRSQISGKLNGLSSFATRATTAMDSSRLSGQLGIGLLLGAAWSPCVGPTLGIAMGLAGARGGVVQAALMMVMFGFGLSTPLLGIAYGLRGYFQSRRSAMKAWSVVGTKVLGASVVAVGLLILTGMDQKLEAHLVKALPSWYLELSTSPAFISRGQEGD